MASIIKRLNKQTGITYVYESESYWDKEKKQPRSRRKLIGKIDEETGEIVPTGGKGRSKKNSLTVLPETVSDRREFENLCRKQALSDYYKTAVKLEETLELIVKLTAWVNHNYENSSLPSSKCINRKKITPTSTML